MIKDLVNPTNFNLMVSKVGDILVKALDKPIGYAINGEGSGPCGQCIWRQHVAVWNLELPRAQDMMSKDLVSSKRLVCLDNVT